MVPLGLLYRYREDNVAEYMYNNESLMAPPAYDGDRAEDN